MATYGGETPILKYGLQITVEPPDNTSESQPVNQGDLFKLGGTDSDGSGYKLEELALDDDAETCVLVMALHRMTSMNQMGVQVFGNYHQIRRVRYLTGAAPALGESIASAQDASPTLAEGRAVKGIAFATGKGYVCSVNTGDLEVEVLI